jgi:hypothetical protein
MAAAWYNDGFNLEGRVDGVAGLFPDVKFTYRTAKPFYQLRWERAAFTPDAATLDRLIADIILNHVQTVEAMTEGGTWEHVHLDPGNVNSLEPTIQTVMCDYVCSQRRPVVRESLPKSPEGSGSS